VKRVLVAIQTLLARVRMQLRHSEMASSLRAIPAPRESAVGMGMDVTHQQAQGDQQGQNAAMLRIASKVARLGGWTLELPQRTLSWSDENCAIHEVPAGYRPTFEEGLGLYPPEHRAEVLRHVQACERDGTPYDRLGVECGLHVCGDLKPALRHVVAVPAAVEPSSFYLLHSRRRNPAFLHQSSDGGAVDFGPTGSSQTLA
jgi:hypothetical protein